MQVTASRQARGVGSHRRDKAGAASTSGSTIHPFSSDNTAVHRRASSFVHPRQHRNWRRVMFKQTILALALLAFGFSANAAAADACCCGKDAKCCASAAEQKCGHGDEQKCCCCEGHSADGGQGEHGEHGNGPHRGHHA
jgi:hypothetical protein